MKLDFFFLADHAEVDEAGKLNIRGGAISHVVLPTIPGAVPELIAVGRFLVEDEDFDRAQLLRTTLRDPNGGLLTAVDGQVTPRRRGPAMHPDERAATVLLVNFGARVFNEYGVHRVDIEVNGVRYTSFGFAVQPEPTVELQPT
ncbi:MAG: DUF6941 family protein [Gaiellaceae bacterium]